MEDFGNQMPFDEAVQFVNQHKSDLTDRDRGALYGLYKRATSANGVEKPENCATREDLLQHMKWSLWNNYRHLTPDMAKTFYGIHVYQLKERLNS